jgi:peptidoglycan/LPS O-acetylase OafA/YrhL
MRMPKLSIAALLLALIAISGTMTYAGYLVLDTVSGYLGISRFVTGLLIGILFARLPRMTNGKFHTVGLLPKQARLPIMLALLAVCLFVFLARGDILPALIVGLAAALLLSLRWMRQLFTRRVLEPFFQRPQDPAHARSTDQTIIDVEFREKKD